jgi:hypothetical protein
MLTLHVNDQKFITSVVSISGESDYKMSHTQRSVFCVMKPSMMTWDQLRKIALLKPCSLVVDTRDQELRLAFRKEGVEKKRAKRQRDLEPTEHPFATELDREDVRGAARRAMDTILNYICSMNNLCSFTIVCIKSETHDLALSNLEGVSYELLEKIHSVLACLHNVTFDFATKTIHFYIDREDSLKKN